MAKKPTTYDPAENLTSEQAVAVFVTAAFQANDANAIAHGLGGVARAKGISEFASETGLSRAQRYHSLNGDGNPMLETTLAIAKALKTGLSAKTH